MKLKEIFRYPLVLVSALIILGFFAADLLMPAKVFSEFENKKLQQMPDFTWSSFFDSSFGTTYEKYINDQFPGRNQWITAKAVAEVSIGKLENNNIVYGKDGYLFEKLQIVEEPEWRLQYSKYPADPAQPEIHGRVFPEV